MFPTSKPSLRGQAHGTSHLETIRSHIAASMIGQAVDLLVAADKIAHGIVSGVQVEQGSPKLLVAGARYDLDQVLTATPPSLN